MLETFLCLLLVRDDFPIGWGRVLAWVEGNEMHFGVYDRFDTMEAMALGGTTLRFRI